MDLISTWFIPISAIRMLAVVWIVQKNLLDPVSMGWSSCNAPKELVWFYKCFIVTQIFMWMAVHMEVIFEKFAWLVKGRWRDYPLKLMNLLSAMELELNATLSGTCRFALCNATILHLLGLYELEVMLNSHWRIWVFSFQPALRFTYTGELYFLLFLKQSQEM